MARANYSTKLDSSLDRHKRPDGKDLPCQNPGLCRRGKINTKWNIPYSRTNSKNCVKSFLYFILRWNAKGRPAFVSFREAERGLGLGKGYFRRALDKHKEDCRLLKYFVFEDGKVFVPSLVEQAKWVPIKDAADYLGVHQRALRNRVFYSDMMTKVTEFRGCRCVEIKDVLVSGIWWRLKSWTKRRLKYELRHGLAAMPLDAMISFMQLVGDLPDAE